MRLADRFSATGDVLFRWRSWLHGGLMLDPVWTTVGAAGALFFAGMRVRKKRRRRPSHH